MSNTDSGPASPDDTFVELAGRVADAAGAMTMKYFRAPMDVSAKPDQSPVTVADGEAESAYVLVDRSQNNIATVSSVVAGFFPTATGGARGLLKVRGRTWF